MLSATSQSLSVIDPCNRTGKILVPCSYVTETKGVTDFLRYAKNPPPDAKDLSLCLLFQKGRCNAGARCNQVHVTPDFIEELRARALSVKSCCARHGDVHSEGLDSKKLVIVQSETESQCFCLADFARTTALELAMSRSHGPAIRVQATRICRLHSRGSCKFGRDCKNIHMCGSASPVANPTPAPVPVSAAVSRPVQQQVTVAAVPIVPVVVPAAPVPPPALGLAFRALDISTRADCPNVSVGSTASDYIVAPLATAATVKPMSVLSFFDDEGFNSMMRPTEYDPLEIMDDDSTYSSINADFDAFVDALVECESETLASPQWIAA